MSDKNTLVLNVACPLCQGMEGIQELSRSHYQIVRCRYCELLYAWPFETPNTLYDDAYAEHGDYSDYLSVASEAQSGRMHLTWAMRYFLRTVPPHGRLLDIGCSTGIFLLAAQQQDWQVAGLEISRRAAAVAHDLTGAPIFTESITDFHPEAVFDAITAWEVLEHVSDPVGFMKSSIALLRSGGVFAISVPNWNSPWMRHSNKREHWPPFHLTFWDRETLQQLLCRNGLIDILIKEKPFAWEEEVGRKKWVYLPIALLRSTLLEQRGMHLYATGRKG